MSGVAKAETGSKSATLWPPSYEINMMSQLRRWSTNLDKIWLANAETHANYSKLVKMETGCRISIWRPFVIKNQK